MIDHGALKDVKQMTEVFIMFCLSCSGVLFTMFLRVLCAVFARPQVPVHRSTNWDKFYVEMLMIAGIVVYFINFVSGKTRNQKLANAWLSAHKNLLESNFSLVGMCESA